VPSWRERKYLFVGFHGKMSCKMANVRWKAALEEAGLEGKGYTLHSIRHACATHLLTTTQRYTRPNTDRIKAVYRTYYPRENELYEEIDDDYRREVLALKDELLRNREARRQKVFRFSKIV